MDTTVRMVESEVEANCGHNSMDDIERGGNQLRTQQYRWQRARWKLIVDTTVRMVESEVEAVMDTTVRMVESEVEANYGHNGSDGRERGGSQL